MGKIGRRDALKTIGGLATAAVGSKVLSACGAGGDQGITTVVAVMMENRSFDHSLGARAFEGFSVNGLQAGMFNKNMGGNNIEIYETPDLDICVTEDPPHNWTQSHEQFAGGQNSAFMTSHQAKHGANASGYPMSYLARHQQPVSWALADNYTTCDAWYASVMGGTWPNRMYWYSGTSDGTKFNDFPENPWTTIFHALDDAGVDWGYYYSDLPSAVVIPGLDLTGRTSFVMNRFLLDAQEGKLPPVCFVEPAFALNDDHPPHHPLLGQQFISYIYNALAESPQWDNCMMVVTYDEHGGFYDHVAPPKAQDDLAAQGFDQLGFRVPSIVAGPYIKKNYTSSVVYDHTSVIRHIADMHNLPDLSLRMATANNLTDCIDIQRLDERNPEPPVQLPAVEVDEEMVKMDCIQSLKGDVEIWGDTQLKDKSLDRRHQNLDLAHFIGDYLDSRGAGRIKK